VTAIDQSLSSYDHLTRTFASGLVMLTWRLAQWMKEAMREKIVAQMSVTMMAGSMTTAEPVSNRP